jgi:hemoglobin/transferrin/lactoferrin receptor protein
MKFTKSFIAGLILLNVHTASAQSEPGTDTTKIKSVSLQEVVISVNQVEETKKTVAQQTQVLKADEIAAMQAQTTADVIANTGNVFVQRSQQGGGSPVIRGFEANRILLVVDGVRMNNLIYRAGHLQDIIKTDNNNMDRIEVLYGPSSTIYGSDALGGVIHIYTKKPQFATDENIKLKVNAMGRYGSANDELTKHIDVNLGWKKFASLTSFTHSDFDDLKGGENQNPFYDGTRGYGGRPYFISRPYYIDRIDGKDTLVKNDHRYVQVGSGYSQHDLLQKFAFKQTEHVTHGLNLQYSNSSDVPRYDRLTDRPGGSTVPLDTIGLNSAEWYYGPQTKMLVAYDYNLKRPDSKLQGIHFGLNYQALEESRHNRGYKNNVRTDRVEKVSVIGANLDFNKIIKTHNMRFGADVQMNALESTAEKVNIVDGTTAKASTRYPDGDNTMNNFAAYWSHTWGINDELTIVDGVRIGYSILHSTLEDSLLPPDPLKYALPYSEIDQKTAVWSGSAGLIHSPSDNTKLSLLVSTGFRVPNVDDVTKLFASVPGKIIVPNEDLKPERTVNYEVGLTNIFNNKSRWENVVYYTDLYDAIVTDEFTFNGEDTIIYNGDSSKVYANQNKGRAYIFGFSSNFRSQCTDNLMLSLGINYTYGRIKTDSTDYPLDHIPPFMSRLQLTYTKSNFRSDFFINYNGWKLIKDYNLGGEDNHVYATDKGMPAWFTANIHLSYKVHKLVTLQFGMDNVFDTQYRVFASGINAPGRNVFAAIRFHY